jgi:isoleucyl-tRNA synthetase
LLSLGGAGKALVDTVKAGEAYVLNIDGTEVSLLEEDVLISTKDSTGYAMASDNGITVVLDVTITEELKEEGLVRELISKIQTMRKECDFVVTDRIVTRFEAEADVAAVLLKHAGSIKADTLSEEFTQGSAGNFTKDWDINGNNVTLHLTKIG